MALADYATGGCVGVALSVALFGNGFDPRVAALLNETHPGWLNDGVPAGEALDIYVAVKPDAVTYSPALRGEPIGSPIALQVLGNAKSGVVILDIQGHGFHAVGVRDGVVTDTISHEGSSARIVAACYEN